MIRRNPAERIAAARSALHILSGFVAPAAAALRRRSKNVAFAMTASGTECIA